MKLRMPHIPSFRDLNTIVLGIVTLVTVGAMVAGLMAVGTFNLLEQRFAMSGVFTESAGMRKGALVRIAGIEVGSVTNVTADFDTGQVIIDWEVRSGIHVGPDTRAEIGTATLLGGDFIRLVDTQGGTSVEELPRIQRRIPLERTSSPYTVVSALGDTTKQVRAIDIDTVNSVVEHVTEIVTANETNIPALVENLTVLAEAVNQREAQLNRLIAAAQEATATLESRDQEVLQLIDQGNALLEVVNDRKEQLSSLLGSSNRLVTDLTSLLDGRRTEILRITADVHQITQALDRQQGSINESLSSVGPVFSALTNVPGPSGFSVVATGIGPASLNVLNDFLGLLIGDFLDQGDGT